MATTGRVQILARDEVRGGHVEVRGLDIVAADARGESARPHGYGVYVLQGAFTLWNMQPDADVIVTADLVGLSVGRAAAPVLGSGVFVSGAGDTGGRLVVRRLETEAIYSDGKIAPGTPDQITGGVFTVYGATVAMVRNRVASDCRRVRGGRRGLRHNLTSLPGHPYVHETFGTETEQERRNAMATCTHLDQIRDVTPSAEGCEDCLKIGDTWVHLRECLICGHVGCCDSSKNKHATKHFHATGHPIIQSFEPGEDWLWCYVDQVTMEPT